MNKPYNNKQQKNNLTNSILSNKKYNNQMTMK